MEIQITRKQIFISFFAFVFLYILYMTVDLFLPFFNALFWAGIVAYAAHPLYQRLNRLLHERESLSALLMTIFMILLVVGPTILLVTTLSVQMLEFYQEMTGYVKSEGGIPILRTALDSLLPYLPNGLFSYSIFDEMQIRELFFKAFQQISTTLGSRVGSMLKNTLSVIVNFLIMILSLFFFFRNGKSYIQTFYEIVPLPEEQKVPVARKFHETMFAVIYGIFFIALFQGIMIGIGLALFGFPFSVFWGFVSFVLALIPVVGAPIVWVPAVLILMVEGHLWQSFLLILWGIAFTTVPDNLLKPMLIGKQAKIPVFFLFLGILGGIRVYGIQGIMIGPLLVALMGTFIQIYKDSFLSRADVSENNSP